MTKRDFFLLTLKLTALYLLYLLVLNTLSFITSGGFSIFSDPGERIYWVSLAAILLILALSIFIIGKLLKNSDWVIERLGLEKGFDEERVELGNLSEAQIGRLGLVLIGFFLIATHLMEVVSILGHVFKDSIQSRSQDPFRTYMDMGYKFSWFDLVEPIIQIVAGTVLINLSSTISKRLFSSSDEEVSE